MYELSIPTLGPPARVAEPPSLAILVAPPAPASMNALVPVALDVQRSVGFQQLASHDPFLARKLVMQRGVFPERVTAGEAATRLTPSDMNRFNAIADGMADVTRMRASTAAWISNLQRGGLLAYGALLLSGATFDMGVYVGIGSLVAFTVAKLNLETVGARRLGDRYTALFEQLQALPAVSDEPPPADATPAKTDESPELR